jgi:uncharacterized protein (DUF2062 family)
MQTDQNESSSTLEADAPKVATPEAVVFHGPASDDPQAVAHRKGAWRLLHWFSPWRAWRELKVGEAARKNFAAGLAIGVFIACLPIYGLQTVLCLYAARKFSLHPLSVVAGSQLSAPPIGPVIGVVSIVLGHAMITGQIPDFTHWNIHQMPAMSVRVVNSFVVSWIIGGIVLGAVLAGVVYLIFSVMLKLMFRRSASDAQSNPSA